MDKLLRLAIRSALADPRPTIILKYSVSRTQPGEGIIKTLLL